MGEVLTQADADAFAREWMNSWNSRDIERIMAHYAEDVIFKSPFVKQILGLESGMLQGCGELRGYFLRALEKFPALHFDLIHAFPGVDSVVLYYESVNGLLAAETMEFGSTKNKIVKVSAHYKAIS